MSIVDLSFPVRGASIPSDHGVALYETLASALGRTFDAEGWGVHPVRGRRVTNGRLALDDRSFVQIRLPAAALPAVEGLPLRELMLADPLAAFRAVMDTAPPEDLAVMADPTWQRGFVRATVEALTAGVDGWVDEAQALSLEWDVDPAAVTTSLTWYHAVEDRNCPITAARRLVDALPDARLVEWTDAGHLTAYHREGEILDELLAR